jgi:arginyl-tRNA synthetase
MYALHRAKRHVLTELKKAVGREFTPTVEDLKPSPDPKLGDLSFPCFELARGMSARGGSASGGKRNPAEIASEIAAKIAPKGAIKKIEAAGPYVNFTFDDRAFGTEVFEEIHARGKKYGISTTGEGKRVMVEFANPNTHKEVHVGHLRNFFVGQAVVNLQTLAGFDVVPVSYINDLGAHVAKCLWAVKNIEPKPKEGEGTIDYLSRMYVAATKVAEENPKAKEEMSAIHRELEELKGPYLKIWKKTRLASIKALKSVFKELGLTIDKTYYESELIADTKKVIEDLVKKGIVVHSEGAWIVDLAQEKLGVNLLVKSDGTLLYNAKDIALALRKEDEYHPARSLYVIDARQSLAMQQLFATLKRMGFQKELVHVSYDFVTLKEGAMSSRKGNVIRYEVLRDTARDLARAETRKRHADWREKQIEKTAVTIADAALRFGMLKQDPKSKIVFDMEEAVSFDGFTGPYILYTYARICSILKKAGRMKPNYRGDYLKEPVEHRLLLSLAKYPDVVHGAALGYQPSAVAQYLFELCQTFAAYYDAVPVLQAEDTKIVAARLGTIDVLRQVIENGCAVLGMKLVKEM